MQTNVDRRLLVKSSVLGILAASVPNVLFAKNILGLATSEVENDAPHDRFPAIRLDVASEVVGVSHFNLDRLKELIDPRPELSKAGWDWGFGDWETAIGAASHAGRKDIVDYLMSKGASPTIFTYALLGAYDTVKAMIDFSPGLQRTLGPHGISLLQHAKQALSTDGVDKNKAQKLIDYLHSLGDADGKTYEAVNESDKANYLGDYKYGSGKDDGFTIRLNMRKTLSLGKLGKSGGALYRVNENEFTYNGAPSVIIQFKKENDKIISLTVNEPGLSVTAIKVQ